MSRRSPVPAQDRRSLLRALGGLGALLTCGGATLLPGLAVGRDRVVRRRLDLWRSYAQSTQNLVAKLTTIRRSSLYLDGKPRSMPGTLVFIGPERLLLHDDDLAGSTTLIQGDRCTLLANADDPQNIAPLRPSATLKWLATHLVGAFAPPPEDLEQATALELSARLSRPRGAGIRLTVLPPQNSPARRIYRSMTLSLSPISGAVERIEIVESAGDNLVLELSETQKNLDRGQLAEVLRAIDPKQKKVRERH